MFLKSESKCHSSLTLLLLSLFFFFLLFPPCETGARFQAKIWGQIILSCWCSWNYSSFVLFYLKEVLALAISEDKVFVSIPLPLQETLRSFLETSNTAFNRQRILLQLPDAPRVAHSLVFGLDTGRQLCPRVLLAEVLVAFCHGLLFRSRVQAPLSPFSPAHGIK